MADNKREFVPSISSNQKSREQLIQENSTDPLTGIGNRRYWEDKLLELGQINNPIAIFIIDINDFGEINKTHDFATGDNVLKNISHSLGQSLRPDDILARIGGDEFGIALPIPESEPSKKNLVPNEIIRRIGENIEKFNDASPIKIKLSIGYEISSNHPHNLDTTTNLADQKMKQHKTDQKELKLIDGAGI